MRTIPGISARLMKILTISNLYPPNVTGGAEILTKNLVDALRKQHEVFVLTASCSQSFPPHVIPTLRRWNPDNPPTFFTRLKISRENKFISQNVLHVFQNRAGTDHIL